MPDLNRTERSSSTFNDKRVPFLPDSKEDAPWNLRYIGTLPCNDASIDAIAIS